MSAEFVERFSLGGKRALVTGGSRGIGAAAAIGLADAGADIAIVGRDAAGLDKTRQAVVAKGRDCLVMNADLAEVDAIGSVARAALDHFGTIDILVNNAGISLPASLAETSVETWDKTMAINLRAPFLLAQLLAPKMIEQNAGKIINISSQAGIVGLTDHGAYCASKGGLQMLTKVMALEWGPHNIQTNAVSPTVILTEMGEKVWSPPEKGEPMKAKIPLGRFGKPVEVADLILFLASPAADLINGETVVIDGGYTAQ